jgi:hypothetical protein
MTQALLLILLAAPDTIDTPKDAVARLVASVRKVDFAGAYNQLGDEGRRVLDKELTRSAKRLGLDPATATPKQVVAEYEKRFSMEPMAKQMVSGFTAKVLESSVKGDKARAKVQMVMGGRPETITMIFVLKDGQWRIDGIDASEAKTAANEMAAIATLRNITSAQAQFQAVGKADANQNGNGEYGTFGELSGAVAVRGGEKLNPPVLSRAFREVKDGVVTRSGYHFRIFLCDADGNAVGEEKGTKGVDARKAETTWCAYAWPVEYGKTGKRSFFVSQWGDILTVDHEAYSGKTGPAADSAFKQATVKGRITGQVAIGAVGNDGKQWKPVR